MAALGSSPIRLETVSPGRRPNLPDHMRAAIRTRHYSYRTETAYFCWIKRFIFFHGKRLPVFLFWVDFLVDAVSFGLFGWATYRAFCAIVGVA